MNQNRSRLARSSEQIFETLEEDDPLEQEGDAQALPTLTTSRSSQDMTQTETPTQHIKEKKHKNDRHSKESRKRDAQDQQQGSHEPRKKRKKDKKEKKLRPPLPPPPHGPPDHPPPPPPTKRPPLPPPLHDPPDLPPSLPRQRPPLPRPDPDPPQTPPRQGPDQEVQSEMKLIEAKLLPKWWFAMPPKWQATRVQLGHHQ